MAKINKLTLRPPKRDSLNDPVTGLGQILFTRNDDPILFRYSGCSGIHPSSSPPLPHSSIFKHSRLMANWLLVSFSFSFFIQFLLSLLLSKCVFSFHSHHSILPFFLKSRLIQWVFFTGLPGRRPPASMAPDFFFISRFVVCGCVQGERNQLSLRPPRPRIRPARSASC